jgi:hypothetical protein
MALASFREDIEERWSASLPPPVRSRLPVNSPCPFCDELLPSFKALLDHLAKKHRGERPVLLIGAREPSARQTFTAPLAPSSVDLRNCTSLRVSIDGDPEVLSARKKLGALLARQRDSIVQLELENRFEPNARPITQTYALTFSIADTAELKAIDRAFAARLGREAITMADVDEFLNTHHWSRPGRAYADALTDYVRGVLIKDRPTHAYVGIPYSQYRSLYQRAQDSLSNSPRALPRLICASIRFALNDFSQTPVVTGFGPLDRTIAILHSIVRHDLPSARAEWPADGGSKGFPCPVDDGIWRVIFLAQRLASSRQWSPGLEQECRQASYADTLDVPDRSKVLALWAATALRLGRDQEAQEPLAELSATPPFADWASKQREGATS